MCRAYTVTQKERRGESEWGKDNNERLRGGEGEQEGRARLINQEKHAAPVCLVMDSGWAFMCCDPAARHVNTKLLLLNSSTWSPWLEGTEASVTWCSWIQRESVSGVTKKVFWFWDFIHFLSLTVRIAPLFITQLCWTPPDWSDTVLLWFIIFEEQATAMNKQDHCYEHSSAQRLCRRNYSWFIKQ